MGSVIKAKKNLSGIIAGVYSEVCNVLGINVEHANFQIILVSYRESSDSIIFWHLHPKNNKKEKILYDINIRNGEGTVGFILRSKKIEFVNNTLNDPRGSVGFEDYFIGNKSWLGFPFFHDKRRRRNLSYILSLSHADVDFWNETNKRLIPNIYKKINKHNKELELLNQIKVKDDLLDLFINHGSNKYELLTKILNIADATVSYSYVLIKQDNRIKQLKINDSIVENRIITFLNWCALFSNKCNNCPITNGSEINKKCKYYTDFLSFFGDYFFAEFPLGKKNEFVIKLYYSKNNSEEIKVSEDLFIDPFKQVMGIFNQANQSPLCKKILTELIHRIVNHLSKALINGSEFEIKNKTIKEWCEIINSNALTSCALDKVPINILKENISLLKTQFKNRILFIELWQNNINGIEINDFIYKTYKQLDVLGTLEIEDELLRESGTLKVLINPELIPKKTDTKPIEFIPLVASQPDRKIYKEDKSYVVKKGKDELYKISWEGTSDLRQLIGVTINPPIIEKYLKTIFSKEPGSSLNNKFFESKEEHYPFKPATSVSNFEIVLALNNKIKPDVVNIINRLTTIIYESELRQLASTRAAISQVMARNMSHNIGSHVLSKLLKEDQIKQIFFRNKGQVPEIVTSLDDINSILTNDKLFYQCLNALKDIDIDKSNNSILAGDKNKETNESLLGSFFDYLKARMDYLADVTTSTPVMENTKGLYYDMIKPFIKNRVLNDRISGLDKFYYEITVCKPDRTKNGNLCESITEKKDCHCCVDDRNSTKDDIQLSIPNDVLGVQAFYNILENIIRNTAKHGTTPVKKQMQSSNEVCLEVPFEFKIKVEEALQKFENEKKNKPNTDLHLNEYYCISIFDNCDLNTDTIKINPSEYTDEEAKKIEIYKEKSISKILKNEKFKIKKIDKLVIDQNFILNKSILESNQLRHGGWGLIEMDASAAYLRKIDVELIDSDEYSITDFHGANPVTEGNQLCIYQAYAEQNKYLGYRFFVRKPQEILIIGDVNELLSSCKEGNYENDNTKQLKELKNKGIWIKSKSEIEDAIKNNTVFPHRLIVIDKKAYTELIPTIQNNPQFSRRILKELCVTKICRLLDYDSNDILDSNVKTLWEHYYNYENYKTYHENVGSWITDSHGKNYCKYVNIQQKKYVEIYNSATNHFFNVINEKELNRNYSWPLKIIVIDERIQYFAKYGKYALEIDNGITCKAEINGCKSNCWHDNGVPYSKLYEKTNILVPDMENNCNLNEQNFSNKTNGEDQHDKIIKYIVDNFVNAVLSQENTSCRNIEKTEFLVIHLGIIEKLITAWNNKKEGTTYDKEKKGEVEKYIREKILTPSENGSIKDEVLNSLYNRIIVTSGRGKPHNLPDDIRYLNFSVISQYMITQRCKYAFTEALFSARKTF